MHFTDVAIIGAGPSGLCCAISLANSGLSVVIIEKQKLNSIENPAFDGREIALTHTSKKILQDLNIWNNFTDETLFPLKDANVFNGDYSNCLEIDAASVGYNELGYIVSNHYIRSAAYKEFRRQCPNFELLTEKTVTALNYSSENNHYNISLNDNTTINARLVIAADSRFSDTRRMVGIGAKMRDFGKSMLVCRVSHTVAHQHIAREWFGYNQTLALLPLAENTLSVVLTLPHNLIYKINKLDNKAFEDEISRRSKGILGEIKLISTKHIYPLVGVYADKFVTQNYALIGDAAVGMHPVTAHGFNFGLISQQLLTTKIKEAIQQKANIADSHLLAQYNRQLKLKTIPLYNSTNFIVSLFTNNRPLAKVIRKGLLQTARLITPFKKAVAHHLTKN